MFCRSVLFLALLACIVKADKYMTVHLESGDRTIYQVSQVDSITFSGLPTESLLAYYPFTSGPSDESGNGNTGLLHGPTLGTDRFGNANSAYTFDGTDDYIELPLNMTTLFEIDDPITISLWFRTIAYATTNMIMLGADPGLGADFAASIRVSDPSHNKRVGVSLYGKSAVSDSVIDDNEWHHVVWGTTGSTSFVYIDGIKQDSTIPAGTHNREVNLMVGARAATPQCFYSGQVDDIRLFSRALSEAEIMMLYHENGWKLP